MMGDGEEDCRRTVAQAAECKEQLRPAASREVSAGEPQDLRKAATTGWNDRTEGRSVDALDRKLAQLLAQQGRDNAERGLEDGRVVDVKRWRRVLGSSLCGTQRGWRSGGLVAEQVGML